MKLIDSSVKMIPNEGNPLSLIEKAGRVCYKSNSEYTDETAYKFFKQLVDSGHYAMLEHATFIFEMRYDVLTTKELPDMNFIHQTKIYDCELGGTRHLVSGNLRAIKEHGFPTLQHCIVDNFPELDYYFNLDTLYNKVYENYPKPHLRLPTQDFLSTLNALEREEHLYTTFHFICDRGVSHEMVRHRPASFAQESTRYCNYSKDKYGNEITCIKPNFFESWSDEQKKIYMNQLKQAETAYLMLLDKGCTPQQARGVLPTDLKTEVIMTTNHKEWNHFFDLRALGTTGKPHPNMQKIAIQAKGLYDKRFKTLFNCD